MVNGNYFCNSKLNISDFIQSNLYIRQETTKTSVKATLVHYYMLQMFLFGGNFCIKIRACMNIQLKFITVKKI